MTNFFDELKRRNVFRVAIAYVAGSWLLIQVLETLFPIFGLPETSVRVFVIALAALFVPALIVAWVFEFTPDGLRRDSAVAADAPSRPQARKRLDRIIMVTLALAVGYFAFDKFVLDPAEDVEIAQEAEQRGRSEALIESYGDKSIVVLPFLNMSPDPDQAFFADGISEELLNLLAKIPELRVISRSSAFSFRGDDINVREVADKLDVSHVLEGSVRKAGNRIRITAQLIEATTDTHLWSETYDRELGDIFAIQDDIAILVVGELESRLVDQLPTSRRTDPEAYALFLQARHALYDGGRSGLDLGDPEALLRRVLELDPEYVPAYTLLALAVAFSSEGSEPTKSKEERDRLYPELLEKAFTLDPEDAQANVYLGFYRFLRRGWRLDDVRMVEKGIAKEPNNVEVMRIAAVFARFIGHFDQGAQLAQRAIDLNPLCSSCYWVLTASYLYGGSLEKAEAVSRRRTKLFNWGWQNLAFILMLQGKYEAAMEALDSMAAHEQQGYAESAEFGRAFVLYAMGREKELQELLAAHGERWAEGDPNRFAQLQTWMGNPDAAFELLDDQLDLEYPNFRSEWLSETAWHPLFRNLHDDPRWHAYWVAAETTREELQAIEFNVNLPEFR